MALSEFVQASVDKWNAENLKPAPTQAETLEYLLAPKSNAAANIQRALPKYEKAKFEAEKQAFEINDTLDDNEMPAEIIWFADDSALIFFLIDNTFQVHAG